MKVSDARKLVFMYLANDVIQNSKKKGPEYSKEFLKRLPKVFEHLGAIRLDGKSKQGVERLLAVWEERGVFNESAIQSFKKGYEGLKNISIKASKTEQPPAKRPRRSSSLGAASDEDMESGVDSEDGEDSNAAATAATATPAGAVVNLSPPSPSSAPPLKSPPDPELLISSLQSLESAATADAATREQIAKMPTAVCLCLIYFIILKNLHLLSDATEGRELLKVVDEALKLLLEYNGRLAKEMESRKALAKLLHDSIRHQKEKIVHTEEMLEEYRVKLAKVLKIKAELRAHLQNLPDISRMPKVGSTLPPLPSAGDLFTV
ncbi:hypothetical protein HAZT_HAZT002412 [Hyalella azteca]|uniref:CID domain-containing protein n=1 Tax=Hyalella azteca TaxID=294128 RepID=A0A6A0GZ01_HYAAZ|nr:hypothetical protein HAZT_HAZT002412 [Hyalella azteca]